MLTDAQYLRCVYTIAPSAFYQIVAHHLRTLTPLSVTRMGDGEALLVKHFDSLPEELTTLPFVKDPETWLKRMGLWNIPKVELLTRMRTAMTDSTFFAPSVSGLTNSTFEIDLPYMGWRSSSITAKLVDNFFVNQWTAAQKEELYEATEGVTLIHSSAELADEFQKRVTRFKMNFIRLSSWEQTEDVIAKARDVGHQLVLFSGGPAGKYIAPRIAEGSNKVVIDIGNSAPDWLPARRP